MGEGSDRPLTVITGDRKTRERRAGRRRALDQSEQITCWRCENDTGIATSMAVRVILAPRRTPLGRLVPGTEGWICAYCLKRGKVTSLSRCRPPSRSLAPLRRERKDGKTGSRRALRARAGSRRGRRGRPVLQEPV